MFIEKTIVMKKLHRKRTITIYAPDDYQSSGKRYPVLYINDGQNAFFDETSYIGVSWGFYDYVIENNIDIIMVAIPCNMIGNKRVDEYGPWVVDPDITELETGKRNPIGGEGDTYIQSIIHDIKPYIDSTYPTNPEDNGIVGSSMGGIISLYAALQYPSIFKKCAALSSALWFYIEEFTQLIETTDISLVQCIYMDVGGNEGNGDPDISHMYMESNDYISDLLYAKTPALYFEYFPEAIHSETEWRKRVPVFMNAFYK